MKLFQTLLIVSIVLVTASSGFAQKATISKGLVTATIDSATGLVAIYKSGAPPTNLTYPGTSYLSLKIDGRYYTNNADTPPTSLSDPIGSGTQAKSPDVLLDSGVTTVVADTVRTVWHDTITGADIIQRVYPVILNSGQGGQIVIDVSIASSQPHNVQGQYLIDDQVGVQQSPAILNSSGYTANSWQLLSGATLPSLYLEMQGTPSVPGVIGYCYLSDTFVSPLMGLMPPALVMHCDWDITADYTFGAPTSGQVGDMATLIQWPAITSKSGVTEVLRFSLGNVGSQPPVCFATNVVAYNFLPTHISWNDTSEVFQPNPFHVLSLLYNSGGMALSNLKVYQSHSPSIQSVTPDTLSVASLAPGEVTPLKWTNSVVSVPVGSSNQTATIDIGATMAGTVILGGCANTILLESPPLKTHRPLAITRALSGSYDGSVCNAKTILKVARDTGSPRMGMRSIAPIVTSNMKVAVDAFGQFADSARYTLTVIDTMLDGFAVVAITDTGNVTTRDTTRYCTIPDITQPTVHVFIATNSTPIVAYDTGAWQRGIDTMFLTDTANIVASPATASGGCKPSASIAVSAWAPDQISRALVHIIDCAGNETKYAYFVSPNDGVAIESESKVRVYPNPATDFFTVELPNVPTFIELFDELGRNMAHFTAEGEYTFDASKLGAGMYFLHIGNQHIQLMKQ